MKLKLLGNILTLYAMLISHVGMWYTLIVKLSHTVLIWTIIHNCNKNMNVIVIR